MMSTIYQRYSLITKCLRLISKNAHNTFALRISQLCSVVARDCDSWGCCNPPNKGFIKIKKHQIFHGGPTCCDI